MIGILRSGSGAPGARSLFSGDNRRRQNWRAQKVSELRANHRLVIGDIIAFAGLAPIALLLDLGGGYRSDFGAAVLQVTIISFFAAGIVFPLSNFYRRDTRSTSWRDVTIIARGTMFAILMVALISQFAPVSAGVPLSAFVIHFLVAMPALGSLRLIARQRELKRRSARLSVDAGRKTTALLVGTGANCDLFIRSLRQPGAQYLPVGIIDDVRGSRGLLFHEVRILGTLREPGAAIATIERAGIKPDKLLLTEPLTHFDSAGIEQLISWADRNGISVARLPGLGERTLSPKKTAESGIRTVQPEEILNRPQHAIERSLLREFVTGRRVLITGAGGSIGSELARQVASYDPESLVLIENSEFNAYTIDQDLAKDFPNVQREVLLANIRDARRIDAIFRARRPEIVFHAAALKHVPMVELNPCEGVLTNVIGTRNVANAAKEVGAIAMVQVSTDKAVNATNVMGATKRVAEFYVQALDRIASESDEPTRFFSVRFGNVLGSSGSLIPLFQRQINEGGPLTVTDRRMERFFMTIREAVELTLVSAAKGLAKGGRLGEIFVLDMGKPVRIVDIAERMIWLAGLRPYTDIDIKVIGKRPGEKLSEELFDRAEKQRDSGIPGVRSALPDGVEMPLLKVAIKGMEEAAKYGDTDAVRRHLKELVPGYCAPEPKPITGDRPKRNGKLPAARPPLLAAEFEPRHVMRSGE